MGGDDKYMHKSSLVSILIWRTEGSDGGIKRDGDRKEGEG